MTYMITVLIMSPHSVFAGGYERVRSCRNPMNAVTIWSQVNGIFSNINSQAQGEVEGLIAWIIDSKQVNRAAELMNHFDR